VGFTQRLETARLLSVIYLWFVSTPGMGEYGLTVEVIGSERYTTLRGW
jgi:hypothetical protein